MKIAVGTEDGATISQHLGRAPRYVVITVEEGKLCTRRLGTRTPTDPQTPPSGKDVV